MKRNSDKNKNNADRTIRIGNVKVTAGGADGYKVRPRHYRLMLYNESRMRPSWSIRATRRGLVAMTIFVAIGVAIAGALLLGTTPLRSILPGYLKRGQRSEMYQLSDRVDSLSHRAAVNRAYIDNISKVFATDVDIDSVANAAEQTLTAVPLPLDSLLSTSELEREFVRHYEERERFNASILSPIAAEGMAFYPPVSMAPLAESTDATGRVTLQMPGSSGVSAMYRGTIVDSYYTPSRGYTIVIQHPNEFISRYSGLATIMAERGQKVKTGERLGLTTPSATAESQRIPVTIEMWYNGAQINPKSCVSF